MSKGLSLRIVSPEKVLFNGAVDSVTVPGVMGEFQVLPGHAPIISLLNDGIVTYNAVGQSRETIEVAGGFAEVQNDNVNLCVELK